jgi:alpha-amylase
MVNICFYFQVHQPFRMRQYSVFDIGKSTDYFDEEKNRAIARKVADKCYNPTNKVMLDLIRQHHGKFKISYAISGVAMEQFAKYCPEVLESFRELYKTGCVEFIAETYFHSLSYLFSKDEFNEQIKMHEQALATYIGAPKPTTFRNTELIFNNELGKHIESLGYTVILAEGADHVMGWKSPNFVYRPVSCDKIRLLTKNYKLSDDIAFRFSNREWKEWPLTVDKFCKWANLANGNGEVINLFMDYETFGEHQWEDTGIFDFLRHLPGEWLSHPHNGFIMPKEAINLEVRGDLDVHSFMSWADLERDLSAWLGNKIQDSSIQELYAIEKMIKESGDEQIIGTWRRLTTSDHFYYMCTKWFSDGDVHKYFNPYDSPYDSYIAFMNILNDLIIRVKTKTAIEQAKLADAQTKSQLK